ncbi:MAG: DUF99 family protein [Candidatus Nitrosocaldus sp.]|nr:DUF99 family protein [Candidatus Nitrosocaldus sp.]MDW8275925.1 DUF99 family protein [Candidatus Nitrosocaldus sp.]
MRLHLEKKAIRALGIAESFRKGTGKAVLAGVVMRSDLVIDGVALSSTTVRGDDATDAVINLYRGLNRNDVNLIMLGGVVISMYNIIDLDRVHTTLSLPVIGVTFEESEGLEEHIMRAFKGEQAEMKLQAYRRLGAREKVTLKTGHDVYIRCAGIHSRVAKRALNRFLLQGAVPEPIRVARLIARGVLNYVG